MTARTAAAPSARRDAAAEHDRQVPTIVAPPVLDDEAVARVVVELDGDEDLDEVTR